MTNSEMSPYPMISTKLVTYHYDIGNPEDAAEYETLCEKLKGWGYKKFHVISQRDNKLKDNTGYTCQLEITHLFGNQWNAAVGENNEAMRIFNWFEAYVENKKTKRGHYIEFVPEMEEVLARHTHCGYCGATYNTGEQEFCSRCIASEYLGKKELKLLRLRSKNLKGDHAKFPDLSEAELAFLMPSYLEGRKAALETEKEDLVAHHSAEVAKLERQFAVYSELLNLGVSKKNAIYYDHTNILVVGWREKLSEEDAEEVAEKLKNASFEWSIERK